MQYLAILFYAMISTSYCRMNTQASNSPLLTEDVARNIKPPSTRPISGLPSLVATLRITTYAMTTQGTAESLSDSEGVWYGLGTD